MAFAFTYKQAFELLRSVHLIPEERSTALRGRIQHLQGLKFPPGVNTGRGRPATYGPEQMVLLMVIFELLELGLGPERATNVIRWNRQKLRKATLAAVKQSYSTDPGTVFLTLDPEGLFVPDNPNSLGDAAVATFDFMHTKEMSEIVLSRYPGQMKRWAIIDHVYTVEVIAEWAEGQGVVEARGLALDDIVEWAAKRERRSHGIEL